MAERISTVRVAIMIAAIALFAGLTGGFGYGVETCCNSDGPGCPCFVDGGSWDPSGTWIQDVALATLGTEGSCEDYGGKAYYQMRLGISDVGLSNFIACLMDVCGDPFGREAWCSEAVSYWHRRTEIPYSTGFRNSTWNFDWQLTNTTAIQTFYTTEEGLINGRGRWIDHNDPDYLDYCDFRPGQNAPVPGAYVLIRKYIETGPGEGEFDGSSHSMIIDSMTVYRRVSGEVTRVRVRILEGNSSDMVRNSRVLEDIRSVTPAGDDYVNVYQDGTGRKIRGFGIDLNEHGDPIYDRSRLLYVTSEAEPVCPIVWPYIRDPYWETILDVIPELISYVKMYGQTGPLVSSSTRWIDMPGYPQPHLPDGKEVQWIFPAKLDDLEPQGVVIDIDLHDNHPLPMRGIVLGWDSSFLPQGYDVIWADAGGRYQYAEVPSMAGMAPPSGEGTVPIPILFQEQGTPIRHVKLLFPTGTFLNEAFLNEIRFLFDWGPDDDAVDNPLVGACCLKNGSCVNTTAAVCDSLGGTHSGDTILCQGDADGNEVDDRCEQPHWQKGDCNGDGAINVLDVLATVNHILNIVPLSGNALLMADCNADGQINVLDALGIVNVILGIGTCKS